MKNTILVLTILTVTLSQAFAAKTTVSNIKEENVVCFNVSKPDALVFKTTAPVKIWKAGQDKEGKLKVKNALELGESSIGQDADLNRLDGFKAEVTKGYEISGVFDQLSDGDIPLTVTSKYLPDSSKSNVVDHYNCQAVKN